MRNPRPFRSLPQLVLKVALILIAGTVNLAQGPRLAPQSREMIPSYPVGALAVFPESLHDPADKIGQIYFRSIDGGDQIVWVVEPQMSAIGELRLGKT